MRYKPIINDKSRNISMAASLKNVGAIDSTVLTENGKKVLTDDLVATSIDSADDKLVSLGMIKNVIQNYNSNNNPFQKSIMINDIQSLNKEYSEVHSKTDVLLDSALSKELIYTDERDKLIVYLYEYDSAYNNLISFIDSIMVVDEISEEESEKIILSLDRLVILYVESLVNINKHIQVCTQTIMSEKSKAVLKEANEHAINVTSRFTYKIIINSANGPFFKQGHIDTELSATLFNENIDVTDEYSDLRFGWTRVSRNKTNDALWNRKAPRSKSIKITNSDYEIGGCNFICTFYDESGRVIVSSI